MYDLICIDVAEEKINELVSKCEMFNANLVLSTDICDAELRIIECNLPVIIAINIDKDSELKYRLTARLKNRFNTTIIYISSDGTPDDRVRWLSYGATTYIEKPYKAEELLRYARNFGKKSRTNILIDETFSIDLIYNTVVYKGTKIKLSPKLFELLVYLVKNTGKIISRDEIIREVYGTDYCLSARNIDTLIKDLRSKTDKTIVQTIRGVGYKYESVNNAAKHHKNTRYG